MDSDGWDGAELRGGWVESAQQSEETGLDIGKIGRDP
jgi:hypothetical protein